MPDESALRNEAAGSGLAEAEACVNEACALLVRADAAAVEQAGEQFRKAIAIFTHGHPWVSAAPSPRRLELHRSVRRADLLLEAIGRWGQRRRDVLFPEQTTPPCYGADGRAVTAPVAGSMILEG